MKNKSQSQKERLENVLTTPHQYFATKMHNHLNNKIGYLSKLPYVSIPVHIELLFIAKKRPDAFLNNDILKFLTNIVDDRSKEMPKALATTLFMIFGQVYRNQPKPPLIMAKLLFRDVTESQEFCYFEKAAEFIHRVQLTYFFQPSLLNLETRFALYHQYKPAAEEVPDNYFQWDSDLAINLSEVQRNVNSEIKAIRKHTTDNHYAAVLVFFMTMPEAQDTFISEFDYLCRTFPSFIPSMFSSVQFFLSHANASDTFASEFAKQFAQLNPTICVDEYQDTLTKIINANQQYFPIISGAKLSFTLKKDDLSMQQVAGIAPAKSENIILSNQISTPGFNYAKANVLPAPSAFGINNNRNINVQTVQYLIQLVFGGQNEAYLENFSENLKKLEDQYNQTPPPLSYTCEILSNFLEQIPIEQLTVENASRMISIFDIFFKHTNFASFIQQQKKTQSQKQPQIYELISLFITKISKTTFFVSISKSLSNIIVPTALKNEGLPFKQEALAPFTSHSDLHQIAYTMIYAAAKYQIKHDSILPVVLGPSEPKIYKSIITICSSPFKTTASKSFGLACILIVVSPDDIGAHLYKDEKLQKMFRAFLRKFLGRKNDPSELLDDINFEDPVNNQDDMKIFISNLAKLKYLSSEPLLRCQTPNYLDELLTHEDKLSSTPKYITSRITKDMIESVSFVALTKYIFASLISLAKSRNNLTASEIYRQERVHEFVELLTQKHFSPQKKADMLKYYANSLEMKERSVRVSAYVMILILNAEIVNGNTNRSSNNIGMSFDSSSEIVSRESSSVSIEPSTTTATSVVVPISNAGSNSSIMDGPFIVFKFDLPDNLDNVKIISKSLYIDNEVEIAKAFVQFLACSQFSGNALAEFVEKRPLLANCLQEDSLSNLLTSKASYDISDKPDFNYPNFNSSLSLNPTKTKQIEYHDAFIIHPQLTDLSALDIEDDRTIINPNYTFVNNSLNEQPNELNNSNDLENESESSFIEKFGCSKDINNIENLNSFESTPLEREIYRYEMILYSSKEESIDSSKEESIKTAFYEDYTQWFALASLKRYVLSNNEAFILYAKPTLNILYSEIDHADFLTKIMINRFISLLSICYIKLIHHRNILSEKEQTFLQQDLFPKLEEIYKMDQIKQYSDMPPIVPFLLDTILSNFNYSSNSLNLSHSNLDSISSSSSQNYFTLKNAKNNNSGISSLKLPNGLPYEMIVNSQDLMNKIQQSLILTTDEYASKWLLSAAIQSSSLIIQNKNNFQKNVIIPLILSSNKDTVVDFFRLIKEQYPEETQIMMDTIAKIVNSVHNSKNK